MVDFSDETYGHLPTLAEGVVLAHELSDQELELGKLDPGVDLALWSRIADEGIALGYVGGEAVLQRAEYPTIPMPTSRTTTSSWHWSGSLAAWSRRTSSTATRPIQARTRRGGGGARRQGPAADRPSLP